MRRPLHADVGVAATTVLLAVATVAAGIAGYGAHARPDAAPDPRAPVTASTSQDPHAPDCGRFEVIGDPLDCGIFNETDAATCRACKSPPR